MKVVDRYKLYLLSLISSAVLFSYTTNSLNIAEGLDKLDTIIECKQTIANNKSEVEYKQSLLNDMKSINSEILSLISHKTSYSELDILGKIGEVVNIRKSVKLVSSKYLIDAVTENNTGMQQTAQTQPVQQTQNSQSNGLDIPTAPTSATPTAPTTTQEEPVQEMQTTEVQQTQSNSNDNMESVMKDATEDSTSEDLLLNATEDVIFDTLFTQVYDDNFSYLGISLESDNVNELLLAVEEIESLGIRYKYINVDVGSKSSKIDLVINLS